MSRVVVVNICLANRFINWPWHILVPHFRAFQVKPFKYLRQRFDQNIKDGLQDFDEPVTGGGWKGPWKYKDMQLEDHYSLEIFKVSHLLDKITGLQVTSPDMKGREADIPISLKEASTLNPASEDLRVCL